MKRPLAALLVLALAGLSACTRYEEKFNQTYRVGSDPSYMDELRALLRQKDVPYIDTKEGALTFRPMDRAKFDEALKQMERRSAHRFDDPAHAQALVAELEGKGQDYVLRKTAGQTWVVWWPASEEQRPGR
jgi:hypothetical protein